MLSRKVIVVLTSVIIMFIISFVWMNQKYLYTPFTYPKGLISEYDHYSFLDFKKPILIEGMREDPDHKRWFSHYLTEEQDVKNILQHFDQAIELEDFDEERYEQASNSLKSRYEVVVRKAEAWEGGNSRADGQILILFKFYEGEDFFLTEDRYFQLSKEFEDAMMGQFSKVEWYQW